MIYGSDASVWMMLLSIAALSAILLLRPQQRAWRDVETLAFWVVILLWLLRLDRLTTAYRKYLQFDHPFLTALASQIIVLLTMGGILFWGARFLWWIRGA